VRHQEEKRKQAEIFARLQMKANRRLRQCAVGLTVTLVVVVGLMIYANNQRTIAASRALAERGQSLMQSQFDLGLLLSFQAASIHETWEARSQLFSTLNSTPLITFLRGHKDYVYKVAFSPAKQLLASTGEDGTIHFWDANKHQPLRTIEISPHVYLSSIAF